MAKRPKLGGELPVYTAPGFPDKPKRKVVPRVPMLGIGTPGTKNYVQRTPKVSTGTPGTKNYVQRTPGGAHQRKPGAGGMARFINTMGSVMRKKPTK